MRRLKIVTCSSEKRNEDTLLGKSLCNRYYADIPAFYDLEFVGINKRPLAKVYNEQIENGFDFDYIIFCHDDISIEDNSIGMKLQKAIGENSEYAICGVAGMTKARIAHKNLWHLMSMSGKPFDGASGAVGHYTGKDDTECFMSNFGPMPKRVTLLDGVFIAINVKKVREAGLWFDENYPTPFDFYDLDFCLTANKLGLKMTTWPIWIVHKSHGLDQSKMEEWEKGNKYFINKWTT